MRKFTWFQCFSFANRTTLFSIDNQPKWMATSKMRLSVSVDSNLDIPKLSKFIVNWTYGNSVFAGPNLNLILRKLRKNVCAARYMENRNVQWIVRCKGKISEIRAVINCGYYDCYIVYTILTLFTKGEMFVGLKRAAYPWQFSRWHFVIVPIFGAKLFQLLPLLMMMANDASDKQVYFPKPNHRLI